MFSDNEIHKIGTLGHHLQIMVDAHIPTVNGFLIPVAATRAFFAQEDVLDRIMSLLDRTDFRDISDVSRISQTIKKIILSAPIETQLSSQLLEMGSRLSNRSCIMTSTIPGSVYQKFVIRTDIEGEAHLLMELRALWADLFSPGLLFTVRNLGQAPEVAYCIFEQPNILYSGTLLTHDTQSPKHNYLVIANKGKKGLEQDLDKATRYILDQHNNRVISSESGEVTLSSQLLEQFNKYRSSLAKLFFYPQKVYWISDGETIYFYHTQNLEHSPLKETNSVPKKQATDSTMLASPRTPGIVTGRICVLTDPEQMVSHDHILYSPASHLVTKNHLARVRGVLLEEEDPEQSFIAQCFSEGICLFTGCDLKNSGLLDGMVVTLNSGLGTISMGGIVSDVINQPERKTQSNIKVGLSIQDSKYELEQQCSGHLLISADKNISLISRHNKLILALDDPAALKQVRKQIGQLESSVSLLIPKLQATDQLHAWQQLLQKNGIFRNAKVRFIVDVSFPSAADLGELSRIGLDGILIDLQRLAQALSGSSMDEVFNLEYGQIQNALLFQLEHVLEQATSLGIPAHLTGTYCIEDEVLSLAKKYQIEEIIANSRNYHAVKNKLELV